MGVSWRSEKSRSLIIQAAVLMALLFVCYQLFLNATTALSKQNIAHGFGFLNQEAGFEINNTRVSYSAEDTLARALWVGILNTLLVAILGNLIATVWGTMLGISQISHNWLMVKLSKTYVTVVRNVPLILQLIFWYTFITEILPPVRNAIKLLPHTYLSQRGMVFPVPVEGSELTWTLLAALAGLIVAGLIAYRQNQRQKKTGRTYPYGSTIMLTALLLPAIIVGWSTGILDNLNVPVLGGFDFQGGSTLSPEFIALTLGLIIYSGAFVAEIVRSGIQAVDKGQWEAAASLGLSRRQSIRLVVLPQALKVIIPPLTNCMLNLTKNSSLAIAIGYADLVSVANTTMNQTGQAIECIFIIMTIYLSMSLITSIFMNWYNHRTNRLTT